MRGKDYRVNDFTRRSMDRQNLIFVKQELERTFGELRSPKGLNAKAYEEKEIYFHRLESAQKDLLKKVGIPGEA